MNANFLDADQIKSLKKISSGGEGIVYELDAKKVVKIFKAQSLTEQKLMKINHLIELNLSIDGVCFPKKIIYSKELAKPIGYIMDKANGKEMERVLWGPDLVEKNYPNWTKIDLCIIGINLLSKIKELHNNDIIIGDLNPKNILINENHEVFLVDIDSAQIGDLLCTVGDVRFTPSDLQGVDFGKIKRTYQDEYFAIATLLFMLFIPGQHPYNQLGGSSTANNIAEAKFPYPYIDYNEYSPPKGLWQQMWYNLSIDLRSSFFNIFTKTAKVPFSIDYWLETLNDYLKEMREENLPCGIVPKIPRKTQDSSGSMNRRDISAKDKHLLKIRTDLNVNPDPDKFAVLELSTKAVKLLYSQNTNALKTQLFDFNLFCRRSEHTETGNGLNSNNTMDVIFFKQKIIPAIKRMVSIAKEDGIEVIYCVATAAYRAASNRDEIIKMIYRQCGINVKILSKVEESKATAYAFFHSRPRNVLNHLDENQNILMIDQGGGSTELTLFNGVFKFKNSYSLNLGTTVLKNILFKEADHSTSVTQAIGGMNKMIKDRLRVLNFDEFRQNSDINLCIAVGTAITTATGKKGAKEQHGTFLSIKQMEDKILQIDKELNLSYSFILDVKNDIENNTSASYSSKLNGLVVMRVGLVMIIEIMKKFEINELMVSGTGLWYGIYYEQLFSKQN